MRNYKLWTEEEIRFVRCNCLLMGASDIGRRLGRSTHSVRNKIQDLGLIRERRNFGPEDYEELRRLHALDYTDEQIGSELGYHRSAIGRHRRKIGLRPFSDSPKWIERLHQGNVKQCRLLGIESARELRRYSWRKLARTNGWPEEINGRPVGKRHIQILNALHDYGPHTRVQLARRIGMPVHADQKKILNSKGNGGSYLAELIRAGLVVDLGRIVPAEGELGTRKGRNCHLYALDISVERNLP